MFTLSGSTWSEQKKLTAPTSPPGAELGDGQFGYSVAEAIGFGSEALIGAPDDDGGLGAAWVFNLSGTTWNEQQKLVAPRPHPIMRSDLERSATASGSATRGRSDWRP